MFCRGKTLDTCDVNLCQDMVAECHYCKEELAGVFRVVDLEGVSSNTDG